jgi:CRP/FNR family transcriptional regulator
MLDNVAYVASGAVKLTQLNIAGREWIVALALPGDWVGTAPILANRPAPVGAVTCSTTVLRWLPAAAFRRMLHTDAALSQQIHEAQALQLYRYMRRAGELCAVPARDRLTSVLRRFAPEVAPHHTGAITLKIPLQRRELAEFIGITPEHLSRVLKTLEQDGVIQRRNGWIALCAEHCVDDDRA